MSKTTFTKNMNKEIKKYDVYALNILGQVVPAPWIKSTANYNHMYLELHHYIPFNIFERNRKWYEERGIKQKLILMLKRIHEQVEFRAIKNMTDEEFEKEFKISRWELIFNRKHERSTDVV